MAEFDQTEFEISNTAGNDLTVEVTNARLKPGAVSISSGGGLFIDIQGFEYELDGSKGSFAGAVSQAVSPSTTNFIFIDNLGVLQISAVGFPAITTSHFRLASVTTNATNVTSIIEQRAFQASNIDALTAAAVDATLDETYDAGTKIITADAGPIDIQGYTTQAPFRVEPVGTAPSSSLVNGQEFTFSLAGGFPCKAIYDATRGKWLSTSVMEVSFGRNGQVDNAYLRFHQMLGGNAGPRMPYNGTVIAVASQSGAGNSSKTFQLRRNAVAASLFTFVEAANQFLDNTVNVDFNSGDFLQLFTTAAGASVIDPTVTLWIAWRF